MTALHVRVKNGVRAAVSLCPTTTLSAMNASSSKPGTPIRAISSSLSSRSAPSIPPSSQTYEPLLKGYLQRRLLNNVFGVSGAFCWALAAMWTSWQLGGVDVIGVKGWFLNTISPTTLVCASLWWLCGCVPVAVLRRTYITGKLYQVLC